MSDMETRARARIAELKEERERRIAEIGAFNAVIAELEQLLAPPAAPEPAPEPAATNGRTPREKKRYDTTPEAMPDVAE